MTISRLATSAAASLSVLIPDFSWLRTYTRGTLTADLVAGLTVAVVLIPQGMAYALIAGLPPVYGLYAALFGAVAGSLWGSSAQLATGPVAVVSLLTMTSLLPLAEPGSPAFIGLAAVLALLVGVIQVLMGVFRLGFIMRLVPHAVLLGFSSGAAIVIALTQVPALFGFSIKSHEFVFQSIADIALHITRLSPLTLAVGLASLAGIIALRRIHKMFPAALVVMVLATVASAVWGLEGRHVAVVGNIPASLPVPSFTGVTAGAVFLLLGKAAIIALLGFMEAFAIAKVIARDTGQKLDVDRELSGQGLANMAAGVFQGYPVSGSFSRSAINFAAGARTAASGIFTAVCVLLAILFLTPYLYHLPKATLAAIIVAAVVQLVKVGAMRDLLRVTRSDGIVAFVTFVAAFLLKPDDAVFIGVIFALVMFIKRAMWADVPEVGVHRVHGTLCTIGGEEKDLRTYPGVVIVRIDRSVVYANGEHIMEEIDHRIAERVARGETVRALVLHLSGVNTMDSTGLEELEKFMDECTAHDITLGLISAKRPVRETLRRAGLFDRFTYFKSPAELAAFCEKSVA